MDRVQVPQPPAVGILIVAGFVRPGFDEIVDQLGEESKALVDDPDERSILKSRDLGGQGPKSLPRPLALPAVGELVFVALIPGEAAGEDFPRVIFLDDGGSNREELLVGVVEIVAGKPGFVEIDGSSHGRSAWQIATMELEAKTKRMRDAMTATMNGPNPFSDFVIKISMNGTTFHLIGPAAFFGSAPDKVGNLR